MATETSISQPIEQNPQAFEARLQQQYIETLEKTNQQLGLWTNPYGVMVGSLSALFAVGAIVAAVMVWRQSREYRMQYQEMLKGLRKQVEAELEERKKMVRKADDEFDKLIKNHQKKLESATARQKDQIEEEMQKIRADRAALNVSLASPLTISGAATSPYLTLGSSKAHTCPHCGYQWNVEAPVAITTFRLSGSANPVGCPKCGHVSYVFE